jgi:antitoxin VapB
MNAPTSLKNLATATRTTTVFTSGNSQAVRLPKEFRLNSKTVEISRRGDEIVLREKPLLVRDVIHQLAPMSDEDARDWDRIMATMDDPPPQERDWNALLGTGAPLSKKSKAK